MRQGALSTNAYCRHALKVFVFPILQDVKAIFKGVTYESLSDPEFMRIAGQKIPSLRSASRNILGRQKQELFSMWPFWHLHLVSRPDSRDLDASLLRREVAR
jgi:hypothetical protein